MRALPLKIRAIALGLLLCNMVSCTGTPLSTEPLPPQKTTPNSTPAATATPALPTVTVTDPLPEAELWRRLQQQDAPYFVLMRHALAPGTGDPASFQLDDCSTQRNVSDAGRLQAVRTGEAFQNQGVSVDLVLSSQWCRCLDTATLIDVAPVEPFPPLNSFFSDRSTAPQQTTEVLEWISRQGDEPGITLMVTHFVNIAAISNNSVGSGEMVVMQLTDQNQLQVLGLINPL